MNYKSEIIKDSSAEIVNEKIFFTRLREKEFARVHIVLLRWFENILGQTMCGDVSNLNYLLFFKYLIPAFRKRAAVIFSVAVLTAGVSAQQNPNSPTGNLGTPTTFKSGLGNIKWSVDPFDQCYFTQNNGQYPNDGDKKVLFGTLIGKVNARFSAGGLTYSFIEYPEIKEKEGESKEEDAENEKEKRKPPVTHELRLEWIGANPDPVIQGEEKQSWYSTFAYGSGPAHCSMYKKLIYHDLYPGIDVEYTFPENKSQAGQGIKYTLIVHPGANLSLVKLKYCNARRTRLNSNGELVIQSAFGNFTDHAPLSYYEDGKRIASSLKLNRNDESFSIDEVYDKSKTIIIDPWVTVPNYSGSYNSAYDLDYDYAGNVYAYGAGPIGAAPWQLIKLSSTGTIVWKYNNNFIGYPYYGDFAADKMNGNCFIAEGGDNTATGARVWKISPSGVLNSTYNGTGNTGLTEMWRIKYNPCQNNLLITGGGQAVTNQSCVMDTTLNIVTSSTNVLGATQSYHDIGLVSIDPMGNRAYMAGNYSLAFYPALNNFVTSVPLPALAPGNFLLGDNYQIQELYSAGYVANAPTWGNANGFNGIASSPNWFYMWDGYKLTKFNKASGASAGTKVVDPFPPNGNGSAGYILFQWGGLDVDLCDHIYAGYQNKVNVYDVNLSLMGSIALPGTVYDIQLSADYKILFACGAGFVAAYDLSTYPFIVNKSSTPATCNNCNGTATASMKSCAATFSYSWSNGQTTQTATGLCPGNYTVTITPAALTCHVVPYIDTINVNTVPTNGALTIGITSASASCAGNDGTAATSVSGGTGPYTYSWSPNGQTGATATGLAPSIYTVTVRDASGCNMGTQTVAINSPTGFTLSSTNTPNKCNAENNGTATAMVATGGAAPFQYTWSTTPVQNSPTATGLTAGSYTVTVRDANNCQQTISVTIAEPVAITASTKSAIAYCGTSNGSAYVNPSGGTPGYSYSWTSGATAQTATTLIAGGYTVTVTDSKGCTKTATTTVADQPGPTATMDASAPVKCAGGSDGSISVTAAGGTMGYTYSWSNGITANTSFISGLTSGLYSVTITDAAGCTSTTSGLITQPNPIIPTPSSLDALCGSSNGSVSVNATGGAPGYSYSWNTGAQSQTASGLASGYYTVTVTDSKGCTATTSAAVNNSGSGTATMAAPVNVLCNGGTDGSASVLVNGGTPGYTYSWTGGAAGNTSVAANLKAGNYTVIATDANGCQTTGSIVITEPAAINPIVSSSPASCGGSNGGAAVTPVGGTGSYTYSWSNGAVTQTVSGLSANSYAVTVFDANGCSTSSTVMVINTSGPMVTNNFSSPTCFGGNDGTASVKVTGGAAPVTISWGTGPTGVTGVTGLSSGSYQVTVSDNSGCQVKQTINIPDPPRVKISAAGFNTKCASSCDGQAVVIPSGGTGTYFVNWSNGGSGLSIFNLCPGIYSVTITDANGCAKDSSVKVDQALPIVVSLGTSPAACGQSTGSASITAAGGGSPGYTYSWSNSATGITASNLGSGTYQVTVADQNGCTVSASATVTNSNGVTAQINTPSAVTCDGNCDGSAVAQAVGGAGPYVYLWAGTIATGATANNLCKGNYTVTITDKNNCTSSALAVINAPPPLTLVTTPSPAACIGQTTVLLATPAGGTPQYTMAWLPSGPTVNPGTTTIYTVSVKDANGCTVATQTITLNVSPPLNISTPAPPVVCEGDNVTLVGTASGGNNSYTYSWQPGAGSTSSIIVAVKTQEVYTVTVNDGCGTPSSTATVTVNFNPVPVTKNNFNHFTGCAPLCVTFSAQSTGTVGKWIWDIAGIPDSVQNPYHCFNTPGKYPIRVRVISDKGCMSLNTGIDTVTVNAGPEAAFTASPEFGTILDPFVSFTDESKRAVSWIWNFGDNNKGSGLQNPTHTYGDTGTYCALLKVVDAKGCRDSIEHCIKINADYTFYVPNAFSPNGDGRNDFFFGKGTGIKQYKMLIFDRWGNLIFETDDLNRGWNGKANGGSEVAQQDVYVYKIIISDIYDRTHFYIGHVSLIK